MRNNLDRLGAGSNQPQNQDSDPPMDNSIPSINFVIPTEMVSLPSKGLFYPENHPLHKSETIEIKQMTAKEEDILTSRNLLKKGIALDKLIQSLIVNKQINTDTLTIEDRSAIILAARISAYGAEYKTVVTCPSCNEKSKNSFDLLEKLDSIDDIQPPPITSGGYFLVTLPATKWEVLCRALNGYDEKALVRFTEAKKNVSDSDSLLLEQLKLMVVAINEVTDKNTLQTALVNMPARDAKHLRTTYSQAVKGVDMRHSFSCDKCDYNGELEVPLTADFFWFK